MIRRLILVVLGIVALAVLAVVLFGSVEVPMRFDGAGVTRLQLNGGTLTLSNEGSAELRARVPLRTLPVLMVRRTGQLMELGGFDDADLRVLLLPLFGSDVPARVDALEWTLGGGQVTRVTVAGGTLVTTAYRADELAVSVIAGSADLQGLDVGVLGLHCQDGATLTAAGQADSYGEMFGGVHPDVSGLTYGSRDDNAAVGLFE